MDLQSIASEKNAPRQQPGPGPYNKKCVLVYHILNVYRYEIIIRIKGRKSYLMLAAQTGPIHVQEVVHSFGLQPHRTRIQQVAQVHLINCIQAYWSLTARKLSSIITAQGWLEYCVCRPTKRCNSTSLEIKGNIWSMEAVLSLCSLQTCLIILHRCFWACIASDVY